MGIQLSCWVYLCRPSIKCLILAMELKRHKVGTKLQNPVKVNLGMGLVKNCMLQP